MSHEGIGASIGSLTRCLSSFCPVESLVKLLVVGSLLAACRSQQELSERNFLSAEPGQESFGAAIAFVRRDESKGESMIAVGAPHANENRGCVVLFDGEKGRVVAAGDSIGDLVGFSLCPISDVDGDGVDELAVGSPGRREVFVISSAEHKRLWSARGSAESYGYSLAVIPRHFSSWSREVLVVGAPSLSRGDGGVVEIMDCHEGISVAAIGTDRDVHGFGRSLTIGDVNNDRIADIAISGTRQLGDGHNTGTVLVYSGKSLGKMRSFDGAVGSGFGEAISLACDVNRDGLSDLIVGCPFFRDGNGDPTGKVVAFSVPDGKLLGSFVPPTSNAYAGSALAACDVDGDEIAELAIGGGFELEEIPGFVFIISLDSWSQMQVLRGKAANDGFGATLAWAAGPPRGVLAVGAAKSRVDGTRGEAFVYEVR